jgi:hypothetical protein
MVIEGSDEFGNHLFIDIVTSNERESAFLMLIIDGIQYVPLCYPNTINAQSQSSSPNIYQIEGLRIELREPFRRWRITYRGLLK